MALRLQCVPNRAMDSTNSPTTGVSMLEAQEGAPPPPAKPLTPREQAEAELQQRLDRVEGPVTLAPLSSAPITLKATNESKVLFETVGKLAGN